MKSTLIKIGDIFDLNCGSIATVLKYNSATDIDIITTTGYKTNTTANYLKTGVIKDLFIPSVHGVGILGYSIFNSNDYSYIIWCCMIRRCYSYNYHKNYPSYKDCSVIKEWHYYENFKKWFNKNYIEGCELDKDLKSYGNRVYSPNTCIFVPRDINVLFHSSKQSRNLHGIRKHAKGFTSVIKYKLRRLEKDAINDYWNDKYKIILEISKKSYNSYIKNIIINYFESFFNDKYPDNFKNRIVFDIENTISNSSHRMYLLKQHKFAEFQEQFKNDTINENIKLFLNQLYEQGYIIVLLSAKSKSYTKMIKKWLENNGIKYDFLELKKEKMTDLEYKNNYIKVFKDEILMAFDDVGKNCKLFSNNGIPCLRIEQK